MSTPRISGWTSSSSEGDVVQLPDLAAGQFTFQLDSPPRPPSSPPSVGLLAPPVPERNIPRPPNAFIIFRAEFSQLHKRGGKSRRDDLKSIGVSLSRKASDAWWQLSPKEKQRYQRLAEEAKEQHALDYPNYQYRPKRGDGSQPRRTPPAQRRRRPSPELTICTAPGPSVELPPPSPESGERPAVDPSVKADRRRSSSVPVTFDEHLFTSTLRTSPLFPEDVGQRWEQRPEKLDRSRKRRSRSMTEDWMHMAPFYQIPEPVYFDPRSPQNSLFESSTIYPPPFRVTSPHAHYDTINPAALFDSAQRMSPLNAIASTFAGWDRTAPASAPAAPLSPMAPQPVRPNPPTWISSSEPMSENGDVSPDLDSDGAGPATPLTNEQWPLDPSSSYDFGAQTPMWQSTMQPEDEYERELALYNIGLQRVRTTYGDPNAEFDAFDGLEQDFGSYDFAVSMN
ncbi:hypothetical protein C8R47DRAFT_1190170 [Mycena vitilis]|nr:hypothetical protein C8R47DRAFT_1190170 [Mycena vitilis]